MSIFATWLVIEHPDEDLKRGVHFIGGPDEDEVRLGSPWIYRGSHILPQPSDPRGGSVTVCAIPNHISREGQDGGEEGQPKDWIRLGVYEHEDAPDRHPGSATVILDRAQVTTLRDTLTAWLEAEERC